MLTITHKISKPEWRVEFLDDFFFCNRRNQNFDFAFNRTITKRGRRSKKTIVSLSKLSKENRIGQMQDCWREWKDRVTELRQSVQSNPLYGADVDDDGAALTSTTDDAPADNSSVFADSQASVTNPDEKFAI